MYWGSGTAVGKIMSRPGGVASEQVREVQPRAPAEPRCTATHSFVIWNVVGPGGGGGGPVLTPNFGRYVLRQSEKWARAPERTPGRA